MSESNTKTANLRTNQRKALAALVDGKSVKDAAGIADVSEQTVYRWLRDDVTFSAELRSQSLATVAESARRLRGNVDGAIGVLTELMNDKLTAASVRARCANDVIAHAVKLTETGEILERIEALENQTK